MKLNVVRIGNELHIADEQSQIAFRKMPQGEVFMASIDGERARSNPQNSRYWSEITALCAMIPESMQALFWNHVLESLKLEQVDEDSIHEYLKLVIGVPSIAFDRLAHVKACEYFQKADAEIGKLKTIAENMT